MRDSLDRGRDLTSVTDDRLRLLDQALAQRVPQSTTWPRFQRAFAAPNPGTDFWIEHPPLDQNADQHLVVLLRRDGAVQVEWHVTEKRGSPFELFMACDREPVAEVIDAAAEFVATVVQEETVLAYHGGFWRGGRRFLSAHEVAGARRDKHLQWMVSWNGTHTWHR